MALRFDKLFLIHDTGLMRKMRKTPMPTATMATAARVRKEVIPSVGVEGELWRVVLRMRMGRIHRQP